MLAHEAVAWMLTYLLHSTLLLGLAWLASKPLSRWSVAAEEAVWKLALVGAIVTASLQFAIGWEPAAGQWRLAETAARPAAVETAAIPAVDLAAPSTPVSISTREAETIAPPAAAPAAPGLSLPRLSTLAMEAWLFGMIALLAMHGASYLRLRRRLRPRPRVVGGTLHSQLRGLTLQAGLGKEVRLTCSSRLPVPVAFRSEICVPPRALAGLTDEQQEGMLAHELAHLVRRDSLWLVVSQAVSCILFFQPLNWVARRRLREISEMLSDEWAVSRTGRPLSLAGCLAEVAGWSSSGSMLRPLPVPGMADRPSSLGRRIRRLLDETRSPEHPARRWWLAGAMVVLVVAVAAAAPAVSTSRSEPQEPASPQQAAKAQAPEPPKAKEHWVIEGEEHDVAEAAPERDQHSEQAEEESADYDSDDYDSDDYSNFDFDFDADAFAGQVNESVAWALATADAQLAALSEQHTLSQEERERLEQEIERANEKIQGEIGPRMEQLSRQLAEKMAHLQEQSAEMQKLQSEMAALAERMRPSPEEMARLHAQIEEQVQKMRADGELSRQEREEIARNAREMARQMRPTEEQRQQMRQLAQEMRKQQRELSERYRAEHNEEIEKAQREMREEIRREVEAAHEELRRALDQQRRLMDEQRRERREEIRKERRREEPKEAPKAKEKPQEAKPPAGA
jgi:bla regulator protein blaR1